MVYTCIPDFSGSCGQGYTAGPWASTDAFGTPVPLTVKRYRLDPGARVRDIQLGRTEAMAYVIEGSGTALASPRDGEGEPFPLGTESGCGCRPVTASPSRPAPGGSTCLWRGPPARRAASRRCVRSSPPVSCRT